MYLLIPKTSAYARLNFRLSAMVLISARETIFSASNKKNLAISLGRIKSLIKISGPTSLVNSFSNPSILILMFSDSFLTSYSLLINILLQGTEGI